MIEREWIYPGAGLTAAGAATALALMPDARQLLPALAILPAWMAAVTIIASAFALARLSIRGEEHPIAAFRDFVTYDWHRIGALMLAMGLAGLNLITFMWLKPLLNAYVPFRADSLLASMDKVMFLGNDPWTLLTWANIAGAGLFYHPAWFIAIIIALLTVKSAVPSPEKSALILTYFMLWTVVAPMVHCLLPAAGPLFYERLGYGHRFSGLVPGPETRAVFDWLWQCYSQGPQYEGNGISAMPSMHVAMSSWVLLVAWVQARRWFLPTLAFHVTICTLSIALGWHYAMDGLIGGIATALVYTACHDIYRLRAALAVRGKPASASFRDPSRQ
ncbi:phosphatase PAP2 family protein [Novosphingobium sp. BL-8H]|uniref:phosphatase PAP2 family protein n=1 Tax=Novosphingobium sp. BL-8H TaxID=3127640 RepID=UPI0037576ED9